MSEPVGQGEAVGDAQQAVPETVASAVRAGQMLRQAREATGLHVAALAVSLKVPVAKLEALEAGRMDLLPDLTFTRALAATVCRTLKIDPAPVLENLPATAVSRLGADAPAMSTPFRPPGSSVRLSFRGQMPSPAVIAVAVLLLAAVAVVLWPKAPETTVAVLAPGAESSGTPMAPTPSPDASTPAVEPVPAVTEAAAPVVPAAPAAVVAPAPAAATPVPQTPAASAAVAAVPGNAQVVLTAKAESWVKITDAKGVVVLGRTLNPGEVVEVAGAFPMSMVVGRADAVQLQVRGQAYDIAPFTKDHVARFEVK
ncbi:helix-turn-helix domain-containing protein [Rhodoferax sp.]|uniref:helix-turn-helix domain-containing protein n=1 Tax=Rhodoferax sp. TaxID=50421 RepID=UPI00374CB062